MSVKMLVEMSAEFARFHQTHFYYYWIPLKIALFTLVPLQWKQQCTLHKVHFGLMFQCKQSESNTNTNSITNKNRTKWTAKRRKCEVFFVGFCDRVIHWILYAIDVMWKANSQIRLSADFTSDDDSFVISIRITISQLVCYCNE